MIWLIAYQAAATAALCAVVEKSPPKHGVEWLTAIAMAELWPAFMLFLVFRRLL